MQNKILNQIKLYKNKQKYLIHAFWTIPIVMLVRILRPLVLIRFGSLNSVRIGHFVPDAAIHTALKNKQKNRCIDFFHVANRVSNEQWHKMVKRHLLVWQWTRFLSWTNQLLPGGAIHHRPSSLSPRGSRDREGVLYKTNTVIPFLDEETVQAKKWLTSKGWQEGQPFVCLLVRDSAFLARHPFHGDGSQSTYDAYNYHDYRNTNIEDYLPLMDWFTEQGVWVLRMGKLMEHPIKSTNDRIIDYAFLDDKNDLLDIWLFANCTACITTGTGPDIVSYVYKKPLLFLNSLPLKCIWSYANCTWIPKNLYWRSTNFSFTLKEYLKHGYVKNNEYDKANIDIRDLEPEEILNSGKEFWSAIKNKNILVNSDAELQKKFWEILQISPVFELEHNWINPEARICPYWLRNRNSNFFK